MSGYIYVIRHALYEYTNDQIYKVGRTEHTNPFQYLKSRYDKGFMIFILMYVDNVRTVEHILLKTLKFNSSNFRVHSGRETFELIGDSNINDIIKIVINIIENIIHDKEDSDDEYSDDEEINSLNVSVGSIDLNDI